MDIWVWLHINRSSDGHGYVKQVFEAPSSSLWKSKAQEITALALETLDRPVASRADETAAADTTAAAGLPPAQAQAVLSGQRALFWVRRSGPLP